jgi:hypothetical protein
MVLAVALLFGGTRAWAESSQSPLSWRSLKTTEAGALAPRSLGHAIRDSKLVNQAAMEQVELSDARPYGEATTTRALLMRIDAVPVEIANGRRANVTLTVAVDAVTNELICAFTPESQDWVFPVVSSTGIEETVQNVGIVSSPARYSRLRSSLEEVLAALWEGFAVNPARSGQIIIRPRFVEYTRAFRDVEKRIPLHEPCNVWLVEVLGTKITEHELGGRMIPVTTLVANFRDGDLKLMPSVILP